ncbi:SDR family oxidoreductase [Pseudonocardia sp. NPDC046786]|uniref:SDR family NAD(P)-dependent oxidoreductase n=1 Tax=Pseudonocardia sp. NPDC046786 TaxID=3155471 RepID=UPI0033E2F9C2
MSSDSPVAVVTGGGRGIGRGVSRSLAKGGFRVVVGYHAGTAAAEETVAELKELGTEAVAVRGDISQHGVADELVSAAVSNFGRLDGWVNNAGILITKPLLELTEQDAVDSYRVNFLGSLFGVQAAARHFTGIGGGAIVNVNSEAAIRAWPLYGAYSPSKFAQTGLNQVASLELGPLGIRVNSVSPGIVETDLIAEKWATESQLTGTSVDEIRSGVQALTSLGTLSTPDDIGEAVTWLLSDRAKNINGQNLVVNGGGPTLH